MLHILKHFCTIRLFVVCNRRKTHHRSEQGQGHYTPHGVSQLFTLPYQVLQDLSTYAHAQTSGGLDAGNEPG